MAKIESPIYLVGNLVRDPDLRFSTGGVSYAKFTIAVNHQGKPGTEEKTSFIDVTAFGHLADNLAESMQRGDRCFVAGKLQQSNWETTSGDKRSKLDVIADLAGPDLAYCTVGIVRNVRKEGNSDRIKEPTKEPTKVKIEGEPDF
jgi:single-strand DNA-binding protein